MFLFMLILHPWDYQELTDLPRFTDGTKWESKTKVDNFHFLTLKNSHLCPDSWIFSSWMRFLYFPMMELYKTNSFKPWLLVTTALQAFKLIKIWFFDIFESLQLRVPLWSHEFFYEIHYTHAILSFYKRNLCDLNGTWKKKPSKLKDQ